MTHLCYLALESLCVFEGLFGVFSSAYVALVASHCAVLSLAFTVHYSLRTKRKNKNCYADNVTVYFVARDLQRYACGHTYVPN